jgi:hypothetical protein
MIFAGAEQIQVAYGSLTQHGGSRIPCYPTWAVEIDLLST